MNSIKSLLSYPRLNTESSRRTLYSPREDRLAYMRRSQRGFERTLQSFDALATELRQQNRKGLEDVVLQFKEQVGELARVLRDAIFFDQTVFVERAARLSLRAAELGSDLVEIVDEQAQDPVQLQAILQRVVEFGNSVLRCSVLNAAYLVRVTQKKQDRRRLLTNCLSKRKLRKFVLSTRSDIANSNRKQQLLKEFARSVSADTAPKALTSQT